MANSVVPATCWMKCLVHKDTVTEKHVTERLIELEPEAAVSYVLLDNSYTDVEKCMPAKRIKDLLKDGRIAMKPGLSWIEGLLVVRVKLFYYKRLVK